MASAPGRRSPGPCPRLGGDAEGFPQSAVPPRAGLEAVWRADRGGCLAAPAGEDQQDGKPAGLDPPREPAVVAGQWAAAGCASRLHHWGDPAVPASGAGSQGGFAGQAGEPVGGGEQRLGGQGIPRPASTPQRKP